MTEKRLESK